MKNWMKCMILAGAAMSQNLSPQEIQVLVETIG